MANQRVLNNPPITEALLDLRVNLSKSFKVEDFRIAQKQLSKKYSIVEKQRFFKGMHQIRDGKHQTITEDEGINGYLYKTDDKKDIVQFRRDGFTFNRLNPYKNWEYLIKETKELWPLYKEIAKPEEVNRLAVRYINHIKLPHLSSTLEYSKYLKVSPNIPKELPQKVLTFLNRISLHGFDDNIRANITQSIKEDSQDPYNKVVVILDIDVYKKISQMEDNEIWECFDKLREIKNKIFFQFITEKTVELFE